MACQRHPGVRQRPSGVSMTAPASSSGSAGSAILANPELHRREGAGFAFIIGCATAFAFITPFSRISYDSGATPLTIVMLRTGAFVLVALTMLLVKRQRLQLSRHGLINSFWLAVTAYGMSVGYLSSVAFIPVSLSVLILYTNPLLAGLISALTGRERLTPSKCAALILAFIGLALAIGPTFDVLDWRGIAWSVAAAVSVASTSVFGGRAISQDPPLTVNFFTNLWLLPLVLLLGPFTGSWGLPSSALGGLAAAGAVSCYITGYMLWFLALQRITGMQVSMMMNVEPVVTIAFAVLVLGENLSLIQYGGVVLTILALMAFTLGSRRRRSG
jgi:drug/metabolite transporter (DMT)-like permease